MNKLLISLAVASALGLSGCGGESLQKIKDEQVGSDKVLIPLSRVVFDPSNSKLSVPNDLLFQGTTDGTLEMPGEKLSPINYADPQTALGALDGWSTQNPFSIELSMAGGVTLDGATVAMADSVKVYEMLMGDPASSDASCRAVPRGAACKVVATLAFGKDFLARATGNNIAVIPLKPLKQATTYLVALTTSIKDSEGRSVAPSPTYELVKQDLATLPLGSEAQRSLQGVINSFENAVATQSVAKQDIIYTAAITTQSTSPVLATAKQLLVAELATKGLAALPKINVTNLGVTAADVVLPGVTLEPTDPRFAFKMAKLYSGKVALPYYLGVSDKDKPTAAMSTKWQASCDSGAMIAALSATQIAALEAKLTPEQVANDAKCKALSGGKLRDFGLDKTRHLTKFNSIPKANALPTLDVQITVPDATLLKAAFNIDKPAKGWPVVMLQHGISSCKENMLALSGALTAAGFATVAIDHPLHGSRGFDTNGDGDKIDATDLNAAGAGCGYPVGNPTTYMNLSDLLVIRDNMRQSVADMLGLRLALNNLSETGLLDGSDVQFVGHSLGAITGADMVALANTTLGSAQVDGMFALKSATLAMPGGAVANFLLESTAFGNTIKSSIMLGSPALATGFKTFVGLQGACADITIAAQYPICAAPLVPLYLKDLTERNQTATLATIAATISQFAFAAQTVIDAGDPNNYAGTVVANKTPLFVIEVAGGQNGYSADHVIPNKTSSMPLAGTTPLAALLGAKQIDATAGLKANEGALISRFVEGEHGTILSPASGTTPKQSPALKANAEMQKQVASFVKSGGKAVLVTDPSVLKAN
jgi:Pla-1/cef family extracellular lipase